MGDWLGKYGEAVYDARSWVRFGEGPAQIGAGHWHMYGVGGQAPSTGTHEDIRFTRSKDNRDLYAIVLGWPGDNEILSITSLSGEVFAVEYLAWAIKLSFSDKIPE